MEALDTQQVWSRVLGNIGARSLVELLEETATAVIQYGFLSQECTGLDKKVLGKLEKLEGEHLAILETLCYFLQGECPQYAPVLEAPTCLTIALRERYLSAQRRRGKLLQLATQCPAVETRLLHMAQELAWCCDGLLTLATRRVGT